MHTSHRYKERLKLKFLKTGRHSGGLDGSKWTFLSGDIDDFRSGAPVRTKGDDMVKKSTANPIPLIDTKSSEVLNKSSGSHTYLQLKSSVMRDNPGFRTLYTK